MSYVNMDAKVKANMYNCETEEWYEETMTVADLLYQFAEIPEIEIVSCDECKFAMEYGPRKNGGLLCFKCPGSPGRVKKTDFCRWGKLKDEKRSDHCNGRRVY